ncbi:MAG TPA: CUAEP/CCAEP-tail radical SAM protein, partial [Candidatus Eisenbacteria bacterium]|nr:CUAEP/CCAEP-tail radical SAM protein [Candidatus Eisenbacteria bacterium]
MTTDSAPREHAARVLLVSTYDLGRQPFALGSAAAWLARAGCEVRALDLAVEARDDQAIAWADVVAFHLPMHTATRLAGREIPHVRRVNPRARVLAFGLYAAINADWLATLGVERAIGGEFERALADEVLRGAPRPAGEPVGVTSHERIEFLPPARQALPGLERYAHLHDASGALRVVGATEATRGCKHRCRHCPVTPVYGGRFRAIPREVVMADVRALVEGGATHITFGDPDFWNGIGHALPLVRTLHREFPHVSYDVTIKIEHLRRHDAELPVLRDTGCAFVTSAVESVDDAVLARLDKGHTRADFEAVARRFQSLGMALQPTFVAFHPWLTPAGYRELLEAVDALDLIEHVAPVQWSLRLLIPAGSRLLELDEVRRAVGAFDPQWLVHPWAHPDPAVDALQREVEACARAASAAGESRGRVFQRVAALADEAAGDARTSALARG